MSITKLTEGELSAAGVSSLPTRPNAAKQFGGREYTPKELKNRFDALPRLIAARFNDLLDAMACGDILQQIRTAEDGQTLAARLAELHTAVQGCRTDVDHALDMSQADSAPTEGSTNHVLSGGVYAALAVLSDALDAEMQTRSGVDEAHDDWIEALNTDIRSLHLVMTDDFRIALSCDPNGDEPIDSTCIDLPLESVVVSAAFDPDAKSLSLTLQNGTSVTLPLSDLISGLVPDSRTVCGKPLTDDLSLSVSDIEGAMPLSGGTIHGDLSIDDDGTLEAPRIAARDIVNYDDASVSVAYMGDDFVELFRPTHVNGLLEEGETPWTNAAAPALPEHLTNRGYVDGELAELYRVLGQTVIRTVTVEDTYDARLTAGGLPVLDGTRTTVLGVRGATVPGVNLAPVSEASEASDGVTFTTLSAAGTVSISGTLTEGAAFAGAYVTPWIPLPAGTYTVCVPHKIQGVSWQLRGTDHQGVAELSANGTAATAAVTLDAAGQYRLYVAVHSSLTGTVDYTETPMLLRGDVTGNLPAFEPYFAGLRTAAFGGILSTGKNRLALTAADTTRNGITFAPDAAAGTLRLTGRIAAPATYSYAMVSRYCELPAGVYTLLAPNKMAGVQFALRRRSDGSTAAELNWAGTRTAKAVTLDAPGEYYLYAYVHGTLTGEIDYTETPMLVAGDVTEDPPAFEAYREDAAFAPAAPLLLGKWDRLDPTTGTVVRATATATHATPYTAEELAAYDDYVLSADGKTLAWRGTETQESVVIPETYRAWRGGQERILGAAGETAAAPLPTVEQTYYTVKGANA